MAIETIIARYGLLAIFAGAGLEGEAVVLAGGILAHQGLLPLWGVAVAAAAGSCLIDQLWFWLGRRFRDHRRIKAVTRKPAFARALRLLERHPTAFIFGFRFLYGLRTVSPIAIGASSIRSRQFVPLNMLAAAVWGPLIAGAGYVFGEAVDPVLHELRGAVIIALLALLAVGAVVALWRLCRTAS